MSSALEGVAIQFYRGIGNETQYISPFTKINFFIGPNNAGKSIVLNFLSSVLFSETVPSLGEAERHRGPIEGTFRHGVAVNAERLKERCINEARSLMSQNSYWTGFGPQILTGISELIELLARDDGMVWFSRGVPSGVNLFDEFDLKALMKTSIAFEHIGHFYSGISGGSVEHQIERAINGLVSRCILNPATVKIIPAKRQLGGKGENLTDLSGRGLIDHLAFLQSPDFHQRKERDKFDKINDFLREITGKHDARLEVPSERQHLLVHMDNKVLPLSSLGTGIHEVIIIAAFCTINDGCIMCIEEPEIHLHPSLQRKLIKYLTVNTSSQYFIATHSPTFIDFPDSSVFSVVNDGKQTRVTRAISSLQHRSVVDSLGFKASDLLQANAIVWVEGPSDRIYLRHWLAAVDPALTEGIHFSIMFYGGSLVSHLTVSDEALDAFIRLRSINKNIAIIFDSDKESKDSELKPHVMRVRTEMGQGSGVVWVSAGREIENYVRPNVLHDSLKRLHSKIYSRPHRTGQFDNAFHFFKKEKDRETLYKNADKVALANMICEAPADLQVLDLQDRIQEIANMIRHANA